eukprot:jgi/Mesen1/10842/ME000093S10357
MSRPMALGLVLLVLFLTSQSDWKAARNQLDVADSQGMTKQQRLEMHRDGIKEKIILDLTADAKKLEGENQKLKSLVEAIQRELSSCRGEPMSQAGAGAGAGAGAAGAAAAADMEGSSSSSSRAHVGPLQRGALPLGSHWVTKEVAGKEVLQPSGGFRREREDEEREKDLGGGGGVGGVTRIPLAGSHRRMHVVSPGLRPQRMEGTITEMGSEGGSPGDDGAE